MACFNACSGSAVKGQITQEFDLVNLGNGETGEDEVVTVETLLGLYFHKRLTQLKSTHEFEPKKIPHEVDQVAESLQHELEDYKKIVNQKKRASLVTFRGSNVDFPHMPIHMVAGRLHSLFLVLVDQNQVRNAQKYFETCEGVAKMLMVLDACPMIHGRFQELIQDPQKVEILAQLLILMVIQPSRDEILSLEGNPDRNNPRNPTRDFHLDNAIDMFLSAKLLRRDVKKRLGAIHRASKADTNSKSQVDAAASLILAPRTILDNLWEPLDQNHQGYIAISEARQFFRAIISRPTLGVLICRMVIHSTKHEAWASDSHSHSAMIYGLPPLLMDLAKHVNSESEKLWQAMETDGDSKVSQEEFYAAFGKSLKTIIMKPLKEKLVIRCKPGPKPPEEVTVTSANGGPVRTVAEDEDDTCCGACGGRRKAREAESSDSDADNYLNLPNGTTNGMSIEGDEFKGNTPVC